MTINVIEFDEIDLYRENTILCLKDSGIGKLPLKAHSFIVKRTYGNEESSRYLEFCAERCKGFLNQINPKYNCWLFVIQNNWLKDTKVNNYKKLWKSKGMEGLRGIPHDDYRMIDEIKIELNGQIKFIGLLEFNLDKLFIPILLSHTPTRSRLVFIGEHREFDQKRMLELYDIFYKAGITQKNKIDWDIILFPA